MSVAKCVYDCLSVFLAACLAVYMSANPVFETGAHVCYVVIKQYNSRGGMMCNISTAVIRHRQNSSPVVI